MPPKPLPTDTRSGGPPKAAEKTVREQLAEPLEMVFDSWFDKPSNIELVEPRWLELARLALARHRAEPEAVEGCICVDCPRCTGAKDEDDTCCCWEAGHGAGLAAQEERVGEVQP